MTIYEIELVLHYHCSSAQDRVQTEGRVNDFYYETVRRLVDTGLLKRLESNEHGVSLECTEKGSAYARALQEVPLPTPCWLVEWPTTRIVDQ